MSIFNTPGGFSFSTVPHIIVEAGAHKRLGTIVRQRFPHVRRILIVTDGGLMKADWVAPLVANLHDAGLVVAMFTRVVADPPESVVLQAAVHASENQTDLVIGLGGGSAMDVAKLIAALVLSAQPLTSMYGVDNVKGPRLPLIQIPTTAGTGSEVTPISIVTTGASVKAGVVSPVLFADLAVLDAELTLALPADVTAATGMDAIVHAIEAYTGRHRKNPLSDMLAREALRLLSINLVPAFENGCDVVARDGMLLGAMLAGQAFANSPVAAVHALAYPIGSRFNVPHGLSNSLVLPHVLRFNAPAAAPLYAELARIVVPGCTGTADAMTAQLVDYLEGLALRTGIKTRLRDVGVTQADVPRLASDAMLHSRLLVNNPRQVNLEDAHAIYAAAY